jgi:aryl-alcohol dehydrogenase-like predicted oxidoreductase
MKYRKLGRTNLKISEIGFGSWGIGKSSWKGADDSESLHALYKAVELGINFFDTALVYGNGHSENLIGQIIKDSSEELFVATKVPPKNIIWPAKTGIPIESVFPPEHVFQSTEKSLINLDLECVDLLQFHVWNDEWTSNLDWFEPIEKLKDQGKIKFFGISINDHQPENAIKLIKTGLVDSVQVIFNIFDQSPKDNLFPVCLEHNIGVIIRVPFDEGALTGKINRQSKFPKKDFRNQYFQGTRKRQVEERMAKLEIFIGEEISSLPELALKYCLSWEAVSTVIPGMRKLEHVLSNCAASDDRKLSSAQLLELEGHKWIRNFYPSN